MFISLFFHHCLLLLEHEGWWKNNEIRKMFQVGDPFGKDHRVDEARYSGNSRLSSPELWKNYECLILPIKEPEAKKNANMSGAKGGKEKKKQNQPIKSKTSVKTPEVKKTVLQPMAEKVQQARTIQKKTPLPRMQKQILQKKVTLMSIKHVGHASRDMLHETCITRHASHDMLHETCITRHASHDMLHETCITRHAARDIHHMTCITRHII